MTKKIKIYDDRGKNCDAYVVPLFEDEFIIFGLVDYINGYSINEADRRIMIKKENNEVISTEFQFYIAEIPAK